MEFAGISVYSLASAILFFNVGLLLICFFSAQYGFLNEKQYIIAGCIGTAVSDSYFSSA